MDSHIIRPVKRRAATAACCRCRARKVRCDKSGESFSCTNCRLDAVTCVPFESRRHRKSTAKGEASAIPSKASVDERNTPLHPKSSFDALHILTSPSTDGSAGDVVQSPLSSSSNTREECRRPYINSKGSLPGVNLPVSVSVHQSPPAVNLAHARPWASAATFVLPPFIRSIPGRFDSDDVEYLHRKGVLELPEQNLQNELLRCYVQFVHPSLPLIDLPEFFDAIENGGSQKISLLLFWAVMFAATVYVDIEHLRAHGYTDRRSLRRAFFARAKVLHDLDYELDRVSVVQSVLLMTLWNDDPDDTKDVWYYLAIAVSFTRIMSLNCGKWNAPLPSIRQERLWKRLYWSCYIRHSLVAMSLRQPMRFNTDDFEVPMVELADFEIDRVDFESSILLGIFRGADEEMPVLYQVANMSIGLAKLCVCIAQVFNTQYSTVSSSWGPSQAVGALWGISYESQVKVLPKMDISMSSNLLRCDNELQKWRQNYAAELLSAHDWWNPENTVTKCLPVESHRAILTGLYWTALGALYRPQVLQARSAVAIAPELRKMYLRKVYEAADEITVLYENLRIRNLISYLPNTGIACLVPAITLHLLHIKGHNASLQQATMRKFQSCMNALAQLRDMYSLADTTYQFLMTAADGINARDASTTQNDQERHSSTGLPSTPLPVRIQTPHNINSDQSQTPKTDFAGAGNLLFNWPYPEPGLEGFPYYDAAEGSVEGGPDLFSVDGNLELDFDSFLNIENSADFFNMTGGYGIDTIDANIFTPALF